MIFGTFLAGILDADIEKAEAGFGLTEKYMAARQEFYMELFFVFSDRLLYESG